MAKSITGTHASIWSKPISPIHSPAPHLKTMTSSPYAAPIESRFRMIAFSGSTIERNARISRKNVAMSTASTSHGNQL